MGGKIERANKKQKGPTLLNFSASSIIEGGNTTHTHTHTHTGQAVDELNGQVSGGGGAFDLSVFIGRGVPVFLSMKQSRLFFRFRFFLRSYLHATESFMKTSHTHTHTHTHQVPMHRLSSLYCRLCFLFSLHVLQVLPSFTLGSKMLNKISGRLTAITMALRFTKVAVQGSKLECDRVESDLGIEIKICHFYEKSDCDLSD